jgi:hypothetical protein
LILAGQAKRWQPHVQMAVLLGSAGIRLFVSVIAAIIISRSLPGFSYETGFFGWVIGFYLVMLCVETLIVAKMYSKPVAVK